MTEPTPEQLAIAAHILGRPVTADEVSAALRAYEASTEEGLDRVVTMPIADARAVTAALEDADTVTVLVPSMVDATLREIAERNDVPVALVRDLYAEAIGEPEAGQDYRITEI